MLTKFGSSHEKFDVWPRLSVMGGPRIPADSGCGWKNAHGKLRIEKNCGP